uniref:Apple domain-containing protein n=1 Tax=Caenorhabditis tropicalis TaxID=1561998 RepID=A0A1I7TMI6_9PELO
MVHNEMKKKRRMCSDKCERGKMDRVWMCIRSKGIASKDTLGPCRLIELSSEIVSKENVVFIEENGPIDTLASGS